MAKLFGTDGIRGVANRPPLTVETALAAGRAVAATFRSPDSPQRPLVVIGRDTRLSGPMLEAAITAGVCSLGGDVVLCGVIPTPAVALLARQFAANVGVVISASHNPFEDNGIKLFSAEGFKLPDAVEEQIEEDMRKGFAPEALPTGPAVGRVYRARGAEERYLAFCAGTLPGDAPLAGMRLVLDCAQGATYSVAPKLFARLGAQVETMFNEPDGVNINRDCGSQFPERLTERVQETGAQAGLAFDGDGDRLIAVDEQGQILTGDHILAVCARYYRDCGWLANDLVVSTVMSNLGLTAALRELGVEQATSAVGDRYVLEVMRERGAVLGGEQSGHMIFLNHHTTGDGLVTGVQLLGAMRHFGHPLSQLASAMTVFPQVILNVPVSSRPALDSIPAIAQSIAEAESELGSKGRVLVRYSGTQPLCRVMVEGPDLDTTERLACKVAGAITEAIGAEPSQ